jgi:hypothetical protein
VAWFEIIDAVRPERSGERRFRLVHGVTGIGMAGRCTTAVLPRPARDRPNRVDNLRVSHALPVTPFFYDCRERADSEISA